MEFSPFSSFSFFLQMNMFFPITFPLTCKYSKVTITWITYTSKRICILKLNWNGRKPIAIEILNLLYFLMWLQSSKTIIRERSWVTIRLGLGRLRLVSKLRSPWGWFLFFLKLIWGHAHHYYKELDLALKIMENLWCINKFLQSTHTHGKCYIWKELTSNQELEGDSNTPN